MDRLSSHSLQLNPSPYDLTLPLPGAEYLAALSRLNGLPANLPALQPELLSPVMALTRQLFELLMQLMTPTGHTHSVAQPHQTPLEQGAATGFSGEWSAQDQQLLDKAIGGAATLGDAAQYDRLFSAFGQGQEGNCASVAVIKAALDKYDGKVFQSVRKNGDGYAITMQDGKSVAVSRQELQQAAGASRFKGKPCEVKSMAILMFAAIARRGSQEGVGSFSAALRDLDNGFSAKKAARLLGLSQRMREVDPHGAGGQESVVGYSSRHAVYIDSGQTDHYGRATRYNRTDTNGRQLTGAFTFV